ncbi:hypothetical protein GIX45_28005 [Erwinia sp. CPCC 100877]|nr:hypothetical protein [Erwinia sp. CPCC 100877]
MNINLLPDKFYKNQATLLLIIAFAILFFIIGSGLTTVYFVSRLHVNTLQQSVQGKQMEKAKLTGKITEQKKEQSEEVQKYLTELKGKQVLFTDMAKQLDTVVTTHEQTIETYQIVVPLKEGQEEAAANAETELLTEDGQELISIELTIKGPKLANIGALTEAMNGIEWIHQARFISSTSSDGVPGEYNSVIQIQALKEKLPAIQREGEKK